MNLKEELAFLIELGWHSYITSGMYIWTSWWIIHKHFFNFTEKCDGFVRYVMDAPETPEAEKLVEELKEKWSYLWKIHDSLTRYSSESGKEMVWLSGESYGISIKILKKIKKMIDAYHGVNQNDVWVVFYKKFSEKWSETGYIWFTKKRDDGWVDCFALFPWVYMPIKVWLFE